MKKTLKTTIALLITACVILSVFTMNVFAAGTSSIAFSKNELNVGEILTVTVRYNATEEMYAAQGLIKYDPKVFQFVSGDNSNSTSAGVVKTVLSSNGKTSLVENLQFKAIAAGKATFSITDSVYVSETEQKITDSGASVQVKDASASKSSNANLSYLRTSAGTLSPNFSANTTTYTVTVPNSVTEVLLYIEAQDGKATTAVEGSKTMKVGANTRKVIVTAEDGTVKTYTLNITRQAAENASSEETSSEETNSEIKEPVAEDKVIVDGVEKYIAEDFSQELIYEGFAVTSHKYNDKEYPAITDGGTTLIYLVDENGENGEFYRIDKQNNITKFAFITVGKNMYQLLTPEESEITDKYLLTTVTIEGVEYQAYQRITDADSEFVFFFAKCQTNTGFYRYDIVEKTMQRANGIIVEPVEEEPAVDTEPGNILDNLKNLNTNGKIVAITIVAILLLLLVAIIILIVRMVASRREDYDDDYYDEDDEEVFQFDSIKVSDKDNE